MFQSLEALPADAILGLLADFVGDDNPDKVDLGVGVYKNESGHTPIMDAVKKAEAICHQVEQTKAYIGPAGVPEFNESIRKLIFGEDHPALRDNRVNTVLTPGGCGALRVGAEFLNHCADDITIWVSDPTWANHVPLLGNAGLKLVQYPYYDQHASKLRFDEMMSALTRTKAGDVVLLHGCCHNPCGADLDEQQWQAVTELAEKNGFLPFIDMAYQGFGRGLAEDAYGVRLMAERLPELLVASSCSKNFGLYRERVGSLSIVSAQQAHGQAAITHINNVVRGNYSMPPSHGGAIVATILQDAALRQNWVDELGAMRNRINSLRTLLVEKLAEAGAGKDFSFITQQFGMFSFLGISKDQVRQLRDDYGIYMVGSSRINIAGVSQTNVEYVAAAIARTIAP
ncbi:MAG: aromatic amino acid aminotransferase [Gammaproteobacteria bacterium]|nr:MAG: aromatic amino acid aminotransferase [Gammaproteobacteria bacterium]RLA54560.1 MAG: aromatic amino acid aminotransferase [Gammaproteobacteria bacterium]